MIFGEADGFPGLTVDRFSETFWSRRRFPSAWNGIKDMLFPLLAEVLREDGQNIRGIFERNDVAIRALEGLEQYKGWYPLARRDAPGHRTVTEIMRKRHMLRASILKTGRKPASSSTRNTTASPWRG